MEINGYLFDCELIDILEELHSQLLANGIDTYFSKGFKESGANYMTQCIYHNPNERHPSLGFHKTDGMAHCFACSATHTLPEVISYCFGKDDPLGTWGWNWLLKNFLTVAVEDRKPLSLNFSRETKKEDEKIEYISEEELDSYRYYHPYMYKRKLTDKVIDIFDIGYDKTWESLTFPIRDITGGAVTIARRSVNTKMFHYPSGSKKPVYGLYELSQLKEYPNEVYICESILDCTTVWAYGKFSVALNGLGASYQFEQLRNMPNRIFILATDKDKAGLDARKRLKKELSNKIVMELDPKSYPEHAKDINDMSKEEFDNLQVIF